MKGMTTIVKKIAQIISGLIFLYGVYIIFHGHLTPGGGFAGGTIITGSFVLLVLAFGTEILKLKKFEERSTILESLGIFLFLIFASLGILIAAERIFFKNFILKGEPGKLLSAGFIPPINVFIGIEVAAALFTLFLAFLIKSEEEKTK